MARSISPLIERLLRKFGFGFDKRPQSYEVVYDVTLQNRLRESQRVTLILPCPSETDRQKLLVNVHFEPEMKIRREPLFGNSYAYAEFDLGAEPVHVRQTFRIAVNPVNMSQIPSFTMGAYKNLERHFAPYLESNRFINVTNEMCELARKIVGNEQDVMKMIKKLNEFVIERLRYGKPISGLYAAQDALDKAEVDCGGFDSLFCSLAIALGIPSRIVFGFWAGDEYGEMHAWAESLLPDGRWVSVDPSVEYLRQRRRTQRLGGVGRLGSDRIVMSRGCDYDLQIGERVVRCDILQNPILRAKKGMQFIEMTSIVSSERI